MIDIIVGSLAARPDITVRRTEGRKRPRAVITKVGKSSDVIIELDAEIFFIEADGRYRGVVSELGIEEQRETLQEIAEIACRYLDGHFESRQAGFFNKREELIFHLSAGEEFSLKARRGTK